MSELNFTWQTVLRLKLGCDIIFVFFVLLSLFGVSFFKTPCAVYIESLCKRVFSHVFVASLNFVASFSTSCGTECT